MDKSEHKKRIKQIAVTQLFGMFNHTIPLRLDDRITIIRGPNGFGKTAILRLLNDLFHKGNKAIRHIPFEEFRVDFDDETSFWVSKEGPLITYHLGEQTYTLKSLSAVEVAIENSFALSMVSPLISELERVGPETWSVIPTRELLSFEEVLDRYGERLPIAREAIPSWLQEAKQSVPLHLLETHRLFMTSKTQQEGYRAYLTTIPTVERCLKDLTEIIETKQKESSKLARVLESTFASRLLQVANKGYQLTEAELRQKISQLEKKRAYLVDVGLMDPSESETAKMPTDSKIDPSTQSALSLHLADVERILAVLDDIASRIELLKTIINKHFLYKEMSIREKDDFTFTNKNGAVIAPADLSEGEQHELVIFSTLLFKAEPGTLVLIDEPENSLHVVWQQHVFDDINDAARIADIDVLMAVHAPDVISDHRDLVVKLGRPE